MTPDIHPFIMAQKCIGGYSYSPQVEYQMKRHRCMAPITTYSHGLLLHTHIHFLTATAGCRVCQAEMVAYVAGFLHLFDCA